MIQNEATYRLFRPDWTTHPGRLRARVAGPEPAADPLGGPGGHQQRGAVLASDEARYITGVALPVDAGAVIK